MMKNRLLIIGAGGHGKVVADIAVKMNKWQSVAFLDSDDSIKTCLGLDVIGKTTDALAFKDDFDFFVAIGSNATRERIQEKLESGAASVVTLIHPDAVIGTGVKISAGVCVMAGVVINSSTSIGKGCIINTCSSLDHDNVIEDYVHISPGVNLAGRVRVMRNSWIGIGAVVSNNISICSNCIVGAGAVVIKDIIESGTYVGVPAYKKI
jgi:sugar O-acyltransferase (sialic acid O-acetyltransferase NeuD family)